MLLVTVAAAYGCHVREISVSITQLFPGLSQLSDVVCLVSLFVRLCVLVSRSLPLSPRSLPQHKTRAFLVFMLHLDLFLFNVEGWGYLILFC